MLYSIDWVFWTDECDDFLKVEVGFWSVALFFVVIALGRYSWKVNRSTLWILVLGMQLFWFATLVDLRISTCIYEDVGIDGFRWVNRDHQRDKEKEGRTEDSSGVRVVRSRQEKRHPEHRRERSYIQGNSERCKWNQENFRELRDGNNVTKLHCRYAPHLQRSWWQLLRRERLNTQSTILKNLPRANLCLIGHSYLTSTRHLSDFGGVESGHRSHP